MSSGTGLSGPSLVVPISDAVPTSILPFNREVGRASMPAMGYPQRTRDSPMHSARRQFSARPTEFCAQTNGNGPDPSGNEVQNRRDLRPSAISPHISSGRPRPTKELSIFTLRGFPLESGRPESRSVTPSTRMSRSIAETGSPAAFRAELAVAGCGGDLAAVRFDGLEPRRHPFWKTGSIRPETILRLGHQPRFTMRSRWRQGASKIPDDSRHHALR